MSKTIRKMSLNAPDRPYRPSLEQFEDCEIDPDAFTHEAHVYVAWSYLKSTNPDVFQSKPGLLGRHYSSARLMSAPARKIFLLPDLVS